jgi:diguanylate cyclase (GGDEF)-like protein
MIKPPVPSDESKRLQTLRDLRLLDTPPEERFDRVTRLAKQLFATEIALVSLVDADRQWFKSRQGLDAEETPRDISFCGHAIVDDDPLIVDDAAADPRFSDNPLVCGDPNIRFYAGHPVSAPDGSRIGTLCVIDSSPKQVTEEQKLLLAELARMVEEELIAANEATTDPTTGLSTRNGLVAIAGHLVSLCKRKREPLTLLMIQLENLDYIEARHGRYAGDTALVELAHLLKSSFRESDVVGRVAPDTFAILLPSTSLEGSIVARGRFDARLTARNADSSRAHDLNIELQAVAYDDTRHADADALVQEGEERAFNETVPDITANFG